MPPFRPPPSPRAHLRGRELPRFLAREHDAEVGVHQLHADEHVDAAAAATVGRARVDDRRVEQRHDVRAAARAPQRAQLAHRLQRREAVAQHVRQLLDLREER